MIRADVLRRCRRIVVTEIVILRGAGTEANPSREVTMLFDDEGTCLGEHDPCHPTPWYAPEPRR